MLTERALNLRLSRKNFDQTHRKHFDLGQGVHRVIWISDRTDIETDYPLSVTLLRERFPARKSERSRERTICRSGCN